MSTESKKILVSGDVEGKFESLFKRVSLLIEHNLGPFEMLLCVGNFFGDDNSEWESVKSGKIKVPTTTYILGPCRPEHVKYYPVLSGGDLAPNITYLGKKGLLTGSSGLKIAYLSGVEGLQEDACVFTPKDVADMQANFSQGTLKGVDILLTSQWPRGVTKYVVCPESIDAAKCGSQLVSTLAMTLKPKYHFSGLEGVFYERLPYRNHKTLVESACHKTRFLSIAKVANAGKEKWLYAFFIAPQPSSEAAENTKLPEIVSTECPYSTGMSIISSEALDDTSCQFFYDLKAKKRKNQDDAKSNKKSASEHRAEALSSCWFCLTNQEVGKHLIVSIGDTIYLALAKGGLTPDHVLILPTCHYQSVRDLSATELTEMDQFKRALQKYFQTKNKCVVFFERNFKTRHMQLQAVPIPLKCKSRVKHLFSEIAESYSIELDEIPTTTDLKQVIGDKKPYFCVEIGTEEKLFCEIKKSDFPLQFGREVLASPAILNMPDRTEWKDCSLSDAEETRLSKQFQKDFAPFDFTLE